MYKILLTFSLVFIVLVFVVEYPRWKRTKKLGKRKENK